MFSFTDSLCLCICATYKFLCQFEANPPCSSWYMPLEKAPLQLSGVSVPVLYPVSQKILMHYTCLLVKRVTLSYRRDAADLCEFILQWLQRVPAVHMKSFLGNLWNSDLINLSQPGRRRISHSSNLFILCSFDSWNKNGIKEHCNFLELFSCLIKNWSFILI